MALQTTTNINVDFYDKKYILINAKQLDKKSRFLSVACYNHGEIYPLNEGEHSAYIRYKKADNNSVFNFCEIDRKGKIIVELTEQMLAADGICCADLVIVNEGRAKVDAQTGEIVGLDNTSILSTMPLHIDVTGTAVANSDIESSYEFNGLNTALEKAEAEYTEVMKTSKSWAVGDTGIRDGENTDNAKYYAKQSSNSASEANTSALNAASSERIAGEHKDMAILHSGNAYTYMTDAKNSMDSASKSETNAANSASAAATSESNAKSSETNAKSSETNAAKSETNAKSSEANAKTSETNAKTSEANALNIANRAQSYAVGGTGTREDEDINNAYYYYERVKSIISGLDSGFIPMGTISFSELATADKLTGYVYNINEDFVTTSDFREGEGKSYTAGTNVYCCYDGMLDCFGGAASPTATVSEVKDYLGI
jgi:hypothetical protein